MIINYQILLKNDKYALFIINNKQNNKGKI